MTIPVTLPPHIEASLRAEVQAGRHPTVEAALLERISRPADLEPGPPDGMSADEFRDQLDHLWEDRSRKISANQVLARMDEMKKNWKPPQ